MPEHHDATPENPAITAAREEALTVFNAAEVDERGEYKAVWDLVHCLRDAAQIRYRIDAGEAVSEEDRLHRRICQAKAAVYLVEIDRALKTLRDG